MDRSSRRTKPYFSSTASAWLIRSPEVRCPKKQPQQLARHDRLPVSPFAPCEISEKSEFKSRPWPRPFFALFAFFASARVPCVPAPRKGTCPAK